MASEWKESAAKRRDERRNGVISQESKLTKAQGKTARPFCAFARYQLLPETFTRNPLIAKLLDKTIKLGNYKTLRDAQQACDSEHKTSPFMKYCASLNTWVEDKS